MPNGPASHGQMLNAFLQGQAAPVLAASSYPFPWPPGTGLSALTAAQEEHRHAVAKAARGADAATLNAAVAAAYGWPDDLDDDTLLTRLGDLNRARAD